MLNNITNNKYLFNIWQTPPMNSNPWVPSKPTLYCFITFFLKRVGVIRNFIVLHCITFKQLTCQILLLWLSYFLFFSSSIPALPSIRVMYLSIPAKIEDHGTKVPRWLQCIEMFMFIYMVVHYLCSSGGFQIITYFWQRQQ